MADLALEDRLVALGEAMEFPDADTLVDDVLAELGGRVGDRHRRVRRVLAAAAVVLAIAVAAAAVPASRRAIARWLGFDDFHIEPVLELPTIPDTVARGSTEIPGPGGVVATTSVDGARVLLAELPGELDSGLFTKLTGRQTTVTATSVGAEPGFWIAGEPHALLYVDDDGDILEARVSGNVLVWQHGETIRRIEGDLSLEQALELATREGSWSGG